MTSSRKSDASKKKAESQDEAGRSPAPVLKLEPSPGLAEWLHERRLSLAFTTYRQGKLFLVGSQPNGRLSIFERTLDRCMGMAVTGSGFNISTLYQIWRFEDALQPGQETDGYDRVYVPQVGYVTGSLDVHDIAVDKAGRILFVNTLFGCLATTSEVHSFVPVWKPPFVSALAPQDRCHLNGLAMRDGLPAFMTAIAETDTEEGWRERRVDGGCVVSIEDDETVLRGLCMPHSPRWHDDRLWLHDSGTGRFGQADLKDGSFEPVCFCPGFLRGLDFIGDFAVMGTSKPRNSDAFLGLPLDETLARNKADAECGVHVVDLQTGEIAHSLRIEGLVSELYDIVLLPETIRPMAIGFQGDDIRRVITVGE